MGCTWDVCGVAHGMPMSNRRSPIGCPWGVGEVSVNVHRVYAGCSWVDDGIYVGSPWGVHKVPAGCMWVTHGPSMGCPCGVHGLSVECPRPACVPPVVCSWVTHGVYMGRPLGIRGVPLSRS